ncbi:MAG: serpin family protein [Candidatus Poribacteria bacterium]|nr:serpin family protein [Candidatus Poribacteria bacterium]
MKIPWHHQILIRFASIMLLCMLSCSDGDSPPDNIGDVLDIIRDPAFSSVATANTRFGFKLLSDVQSREPGTNIFISPLSISIALTMTYNGAVEDTQLAMAEVLEIEGLDRDSVNRSNAALRESLENRGSEVQLSIANSIWGRQGVEFNPDFLNRNREFFGAEITALDFGAPEAPETINGWVDTNTKGKIKKIVQRIDPRTLIMLINAIYFKGSWKEEFDKSRTRDGIFRLSDGAEKQVPMMTREGAYPYFRGDAFEAASLPYGDGNVNMYIFLPDRDSNLDEFLGVLNSENWLIWLPQFREGTDDSMIILPRFKLEYEVKLNDTLKTLGMDIAFGGGADFSGMGPSLFISEVRHKAIVEVNEEGTEAAAVTVVVGVESAPPSFIVDRPFFFAIYDGLTKSMLFMGIVVEPM